MMMSHAVHRNAGVSAGRRPLGGVFIFEAGEEGSRAANILMSQSGECVNPLATLTHDFTPKPLSPRPRAKNCSLFRGVIDRR